MKTIKLFVGICTLIATCACGNTKAESQHPVQATEITNDTIKEEGTVFYDMTLEEALEKAKAEKKYVLINLNSIPCAPFLL